MTCTDTMRVRFVDTQIFLHQEFLVANIAFMTFPCVTLRHLFTCRRLVVVVVVLRIVVVLGADRRLVGERHVTLDGGRRFLKADNVNSQ